jgi:hypothetical protein
VATRIGRVSIAFAALGAVVGRDGSWPFTQCRQRDPVVLIAEGLHAQHQFPFAVAQLLDARDTVAVAVIGVGRLPRQGHRGGMGRL